MRKRLLRWLLSSDDSGRLSEYIPILTEWLERTGSINAAWVKPETYRLFQENGFHLTRNHYYGALPDTREFRTDWWEGAPYAQGFERVNKGDVEAVFAGVMRWADELRTLPRQAGQGFFWNNGMYPPLDAMALYGMLREFRPERLLEIGSGFSTEIALLAAGHTGTAIHCVEPYPTKQLLALEGDRVRISRLPLQQVPAEMFAELQPGDILFIDTTHTVRLGSDVNHLIFNVLPALAPGVLVHIHDIFLPYEYPRRWYDEISIFWNEQYLLLAWLMDNPGVEVVLPVYLQSVKHQADLRKQLKEFDIWDLTENLGGASGAGMWLRKV